MTVVVIVAGLVVGAIAAELDPGAAPSDYATLSPAPADVRYFTCTEDTCRAYEPAPCCASIGNAAAAPFISGEIDLTGDGVPETVRRAGAQLVVEQGGTEVWRSPTHWEVVDAALGDPNDDGRGEILLAFRREDDAGIMASHPFVIGYRGGIYRTLWGGSAAVDPIREVALGDVDGDRAQELVVVEAGGSKNAVTVWAWHGWGFSLVWRSEPGAYYDLVVLPGENGVPDTIRVAVREAP
jgi:hypothetical protein